MRWMTDRRSGYSPRDARPSEGTPAGWPRSGAAGAAERGTTTTATWAMPALRASSAPRKRYEIFAAHWPYAEVAPMISSPSYSTRRRKLTWKHPVAVHAPATDISKIKRQEGADWLIQGRSVLIQTLLANDLMDHISLLVFPVVLGSGKRFRVEELGTIRPAAKPVRPARVFAQVKHKLRFERNQRFFERHHAGGRSCAGPPRCRSASCRRHGPGRPWQSHWRTRRHSANLDRHRRSCSAPGWLLSSPD